MNIAPYLLIALKIAQEGDKRFSSFFSIHVSWAAACEGKSGLFLITLQGKVKRRGFPFKWRIRFFWRSSPEHRLLRTTFYLRHWLFLLSWLAADIWRKMTVYYDETLWRRSWRIVIPLLEMSGRKSVFCLVFFGGTY